MNVRQKYFRKNNLEITATTKLRKNKMLLDGPLQRR